MKNPHLIAPALLAVCALAQAQQPTDPVAVFNRYVQAVHAADMPAVRSLIAADVERSDYPACTAQMDNAACLAFYIDQTVVKPQAQITVVAVAVRGDEITAKLEVRSALYQKAGVERIVGSDVLRISDGKIRAFRFVPDFQDPPTVTFFAGIGITPRPRHSQP
jgi:predicted SnoaL-like aldol condensation-catalyzing enzyme